MNAGRIFSNRVNGCSREFNVLLPAPDRAGDNRLLDPMPRLVWRSVNYGPLNSFRNKPRQLHCGIRAYCFYDNFRREINTYL